MIQIFTHVYIASKYINRVILTVIYIYTDALMQVFMSECILTREELSCFSNIFNFHLFMRIILKTGYGNTGFQKSVTLQTFGFRHRINLSAEFHSDIF
jgi:hypothetical protein